MPESAVMLPLSFRVRNLGPLCAAVLLLACACLAQREVATRLVPRLPDGGAIEAGWVRVSIRSVGSYRGFSQRIDERAGADIQVADQDDAEMRVDVFNGRRGGRLLGWRVVDLDAQGRWRKDLAGFRLERPVVGLEGTVRTPAGEPAKGVPLLVPRGHPFRATTDEAGRFRIWMPGDVRSGEKIELQVDGDRHYLATGGKTLPLRFGQRDVHVEVVAAARMRFDAVGLPKHTFLWHGCKLVCEHAATRKPLARPPRIDFEADHFVMPPGCWNLVFVRGRQEVLRLDNVFAESGIENHDPRLMEFDWRRLGTFVRLDVRDHAGQPTAGFGLERRQGGSVHSVAARSTPSYVLLPEGGQKLGLRIYGSGGVVDLGLVDKDRTVDLGKR